MLTKKATFFDISTEKGFERLFKTYFTPLVIHANTVMKDFDRAKDVVHDVFTKLYQEREQLQIINQRAYIFKMVHNRSINTIQRDANIRPLNEADANFAETDATLLDQIIEAEKSAELLQAINNLPHRCAEIFKLSRFEGLKNKEIAARLSISKRTVETQISNGLKQLRQIFSNT